MPTAKTELTRVCGTVEEVHPKSNDKWSRAKIYDVKGRGFWITAKFRLSIGETIEADCTFNETYKSYDVVRLADPGDGKISNDVVILKLIDVLDGVGEVKARKLGAEFPELYETLINSPEKIAEFVKIPLETVQTISTGLTAERAVLSRLTKLTAVGYPNYLAKKIADIDHHYIVALKSPYAAIKLVVGLGWKIADTIGLGMGIAADDSNRIAAGIEYAYSEKVAKEGHTLIKGEEFLNPENLPSLLGVSQVKIESILHKTLIPFGDGYYTSPSHLKNSETIKEFFLTSRCA